MAVLAYFNVKESGDNRKVFFDATEYAHDINAFERAISPLRKGLTPIIPRLWVTGQEVFEKTGMETVGVPISSCDDYYTQSFGYKLTSDGRRLWRYLFGTNIGLNYGDIVKLSDESDAPLYLLADFMVLKHRDFYGTGNNALSVLTAKLLPFSKEALADANGRIDRLAPTCTQTWKMRDWERYFGETVCVNTPRLFRLAELAKAETVGHINYDMMERLARMQTAPCVV